MFRLSGIKPKLNEELSIHDKWIGTKEIEDLAMEGFMPSIPGDVEFLVMKISVLFTRRRLVIGQMNKVEGEA